MDEKAAASELMQMVNGYQVSQAICVAATLGVADHLANGPRTSDDLAAATSSHPQSFYRLLRALASVGVLHEGDARQFSLTSLGAGLRSDAEHSVGAWARMVGRAYYRDAWSELLHSVRTGENAFAHVHGTGVWQYRIEHPEESLIFDRAMSSFVPAVAAAVLAAYDFSRFEILMDVGGGQGALLAAILARNPSQRGILFDQPQVVEGAGPVLQAASVAERCQVIGGDFFRAVPEGADAHVLKWILHDWDDERSIAILKSCRRAIRPGGRLVVLDAVLAPPNEGARAKFADLNMLAVPGGQERTEDEFAGLFAASGFRLTNIVDAGPRISLIEGKPI
ncbi:methyltransferase [Aminobacter aganoensis]|uniref:SAM-dependent methyltransferase n=1 Tax=Aminobacter aganoensis TaxID=83264 RepID=A0A7X0F3F5_9HYPH|nr:MULTISPECIES: methyltransferase [Aminobacter]KQU73614.1 methyltransferase [Aminobacter sp. DSM 101952]MBB6352251.1 SAM-dependent methyltransferase [Aminobacter aganoensis]